MPIFKRIDSPHPAEKLVSLKREGRLWGVVGKEKCGIIQSVRSTASSAADIRVHNVLVVATGYRVDHFGVYRKTKC